MVSVRSAPRLKVALPPFGFGTRSEFTVRSSVRVSEVWPLTLTFIVGSAASSRTIDFGCPAMTSSPSGEAPGK